MSALMTQSNGEVKVVYFTEARLLDDTLVNKIGKELLAIVDRTEHGKLLLNFQDVRFMASAMLGKLVQLNKKCKADGVALRLCNISPDIMKVFTLMKLNKILDIHADEAQALKAFEKKGWFG